LEKKKRPSVTDGDSNPGLLMLCTTDKYNKEQINVELFLVNFENKVMLDTMLQKTF
jgi:hypothetical protein